MHTSVFKGWLENKKRKKLNDGERERIEEKKIRRFSSRTPIPIRSSTKREESRFLKGQVKVESHCGTSHKISELWEHRSYKLLERTNKKERNSHKDQEPE
jgi:hypothetical protein